MRQLLILSLAFFASPARATELGDRLENACYTEISFFCHRVSRLDERLKCLRGRPESLTQRCANGIKAILEAIEKAKNPAPAPAVPGPGAPPAGAPAAAKGPAATALPAEMEARLTRVEGTVYVHFASLPADQFVKAEKDMPLEVGDLVRTGGDGKAEISVNIDSVIELGSGADFQAVELAPKKTQWKLSIGSLVGRLAALVEGQEMSFVTPSAVAAIRGTELWIKHEEGGTGVGVFDEGKVTVSSPSGGAQVFLKPNQETRVDNGKPPAAAKPLSVKPETRKLVELARQRGAEIKKEWKPRPAAARKEMRQDLAKKSVRISNPSQPKPGQPAPAPAAGKASGTTREEKGPRAAEAKPQAQPKAEPKAQPKAEAKPAEKKSQPQDQKPQGPSGNKRP